MQIDQVARDRYILCYDDGRVGMGWQEGIFWTQQQGSPPVHLDHDAGDIIRRANQSRPYDLAGRWPDTDDYKNIPDVMARAQDLDGRTYKSDLEKAFWLNVARVPLCASYLAACAKTSAKYILELGTGGDSAHSTGVFLYWLSKAWGHTALLSVDRHYLSHAWLRYRHCDNWTFLQGDSVWVMKQLRARKLGLPFWFDLIFIDSSHLYKETLAEIHQASLMTLAIGFDDTNVPEVNQAIVDFLAGNEHWLRLELHPGVTLLERHERIVTPTDGTPIMPAHTVQAHHKPLARTGRW